LSRIAHIISNNFKKHESALDSRSMKRLKQLSSKYRNLQNTLNKRKQLCFYKLLNYYFI